MALPVDREAAVDRWIEIARSIHDEETLVFRERTTTVPAPPKPWRCRDCHLINWPHMDDSPRANCHGCGKKKESE